MVCARARAKGKTRKEDGCSAVLCWRVEVFGKPWIPMAREKGRKVDYNESSAGDKKTRNDMMRFGECGQNSV